MGISISKNIVIADSEERLCQEEQELMIAEENDMLRGDSIKISLMLTCHRTNVNCCLCILCLLAIKSLSCCQ